MDDRTQLGLALYAGRLHGFFRAWQALDASWGDVLKDCTREGRTASYFDRCIRHSSVLISIKMALEKFTPPEGHELPQTLLLAAMESRLAFVSAAISSTADFQQPSADGQEDTRAYVAAWQELCAQAGLPD